MVPDLKWNGENKEDLYLMAVTMRRDISSIRDLNASHIPMLENIFSKCTVSIKILLISSAKKIMFLIQFICLYVNHSLTT